jgi:light-regulated signal transduction histidine kinase (bacteriophytochrome)
MQTLEGQTLKVDVVESYVPVMAGNTFLGAFEIYYDITAKYAKLQYVVFRASLIPFAMALGGLILAIFILFKLDRSITRQKQVEEDLKIYADKLKRSNRELSDFAHVASHDLQEPLRKVTAFGDRLQAKFGDALGDQGKDYLARMQSAASRMQRLIEGLLSFSRVTTKAKPFEPVDLNKVTTDVLSDLEVRIQESGGRVDVSSLPTLSADPLQMRQLFQNLISNALKFHKDDQQPVITVSAAEQAGTSFQITIEDNGIGFDEQYAERIFGVFQRLHGRQEYEGSGIGLSVCRRIVERHGGSIEARGTPGEGATFRIVLPAEHAEGESNG